MRELTIISEPYPRPEWRETVVRGVDQHNVAATGLPDYYPVGFVIRGSRGEVLGGLLGGIWGGWMMVWSLWVDASLRGRGYGAALMARAHRYALEKSCTHSHLRTGSYEARPFYEQLGYSAYGELKDHPVAPHARYFLSRTLTPDAANGPLTDVAIAMEPYVSNETAAAIKFGITSHAYAAMGLPEQAWLPHNFFLRDSDGEIMGGALGNLWGTWMYLDYLWVDRSIRGKGHASRLVTMAEENAAAYGCTGAFLDTFSFQARPLYEKLGYEVFGEEKDHPKGHSLYLLKKRLVRDARP
ncbi:MAG: GNAT family N-acetyltransferase [Candidatus Binataceae bacterium]